jgi:pimeloyl-ACP methyl ester carboxylesterase
MLFVYGERKPFMFHSRRWLDKLSNQPGSAVLGLPYGHWVMISRPQAFHTGVRAWLTSKQAQAPT